MAQLSGNLIAKNISNCLNLEKKKQRNNYHTAEKILPRLNLINIYLLFISMKKFLMGIAGGSGSGKTTLAKMIAEEIGQDRVLLISMDRYYKDLSKIKPAEREKVNFDHPNSIDWPLFRKQIKQLLKNKKVKAPIYSFTKHVRIGYEIVTPKDVIIIEGIFALYDEEICNLMKVRLFVETPPDIRLIRRIQRDVIERGRDVKSVIEQWNRFVRPAHKMFIEPSAKRAHVIIPEDPEGKMRESAVKIIKSMFKEFYFERKIKLFYGEEGVKKVFKDILAENQPNCVLDSEGQFAERMPEFAKWFINQTEKKNIQIRHLVRKGRDVKPSKTTEVRFIKKRTKSHAVINIYSDKVAIILWTKIPEVVVIKDKNVANSLRDYFEVLWKNAQKEL